MMWRAVMVAVALFLSGTPAPGASLEDRPYVFEYRVAWRFVHAGDVRLEYVPPAPGSKQIWAARLHLKTSGVADDLYGVDNNYLVTFDDNFCAEAARFDVHEGKKQRDIRITYQNPPGWVRYLDRDLVKDVIATSKVVAVPRCVHDELAALAYLRTLSLSPGDTLRLPVSNGRRSVNARLKVQRRETIETPAGEFETIRCEAFLFNDVLYKRKARLFIWLTDDERHLPVQFRVRLQPVYGTITLKLAKEEPL